MNTYHVHLRRGSMVVVSAVGYTEDKRAKRIYFHTDLETKDRTTFFNAADVAGVHAFENLNLPRQADILRQFKGMAQQARSDSRKSDT